MDVRIGIVQSTQVLELELDRETDRDELKKQIDQVLNGDAPVLWLQDRKGKEIAVSAERVAFIELSPADPDRRIGFGA